MAVLRITRFELDPARTDEMIERRATLLDALRDAFPGMGDSRLSRIDDRTWIEITQWESADHLAAALENGPAMPSAAALFSIITNATAENADLVAVR
jgi:hypothetical protein